jgi:hypothetical protein
MGKLTEHEIRTIIKRASVFQKFSESSPRNERRSLMDEDLDSLFEIARNLDIDPHFVQEALIEHEGVETDAPVRIDTGSTSQIKIQAQANGSVDGTVLNEIRAHLEYHFNTVGRINRKNKKVTWKATPTGIARLFDISSSPSLVISQKESKVQFEFTQDISTLNKLYLIPGAFTFGAIMFLTAIIYGQVTGDGVIPMGILSTIFLTGSFFFSRFIRKRKNKRKEKLVDLIETLQQSVERHFVAGRRSTTRGSIEIPEVEDIETEHDLTKDDKIRT